mgnify:CR=1 FL=1
MNIYFRVILKLRDDLKVIGQIFNVSLKILWMKQRLLFVNQDKKSTRLTEKNRGTFTNILFDDRDDPIQRVSFNSDAGEIIIYIKFKPISQYIKSKEDAFETPIGKVLTAELVAEAFTKRVARYQLERGDYISSPENEIDNYNAVVNRLLKKNLEHIYSALV